MAKIIPLGIVTYLDLPPDRILEQAVGEMDSVVILGWGKDKNLYFASSIADGGDVNWLLDKCKQQLLEIGDEDG